MLSDRGNRLPSGRKSVWLSAALSAALLGPCAGALAGCETTCSVPDDQVPEAIDDGITDLETLSYESSPWDGEYLRFSPQKRFAFKHGLGGTPRLVSTYVSFDEAPFAGDGRGNAAESAGNIVIIEKVTADVIQVRNDTCETFYLRVYAGDPTPASGQVAENDADDSAE